MCTYNQFFCQLHSLSIKTVILIFNYHCYFQVGDKSLDQGLSHNLQQLNHREWNVFKYRGLRVLRLIIFLPKTNELRYIAKSTNTAVIGISDS